MNDVILAYEPMEKRVKGYTTTTTDNETLMRKTTATLGKELDDSGTVVVGDTKKEYGLKST
jgi:hypothetical protein